MISPQTPIKDILAAHPGTRDVLARHGLDACCGGSHPLEMAARAHKLDLPVLLAKLHEAAAAGQPGRAAAPAPAPTEPDIYPPFLKGAILATLTGGATLGLVALTIAGLRGSLDTGLAWWTPVIQAHGHVQIFGWVGLFIMGVAYHVLPRFKATDLHRPDLARRTFGLMAFGLIARSLAQPWAAESFAGVVGVAGAAAELIAVALFARIVWRTIAGSQAPRAGFERYLLAGNAWFVLLAVANLASMLRMAATGDPVIPARLNAALLHVQVVGFIGLWILGVSLRILPVFLGLRPLGPRAALGAFWGLNAGVGLQAVAELTGTAALRAPAALCELLAVVVFAFGVGVFGRRAPSPPADADQYYRKFIVAAYAWLVLAAVLLAFIGAWEAGVGPLPRELTGSYRHAITVGFVTAMIMGVASRVVPRFRGVPLQGLSHLEVAFWLLNAGCAIRVAFQAVAGFRGEPFTLVSSVSAYLEIPALALFSLVIWRTLGARPGIDPALQAAMGRGVPLRVIQ
jgi:uncharacterized protein DUF542/cytochrome c/quinol oxidase subunit I